MRNYLRPCEWSRGNKRSKGGAQPFNGSLDNITSPTGARILLDMIHLGVTPVSLPNLTVGNYTLMVVKEGCIPVEQRVTVVEDRTTQITISRVLVSPPIVDTLRAAGPVPATLKQPDQFLQP